MSIVQLLHQQDAILTNRWRERTYISLLQQTCAAGPYAPIMANLWAEWQQLRPFSRGQDAKPTQNYAAYRRAKFDQFPTKSVGPSRSTNPLQLESTSTGRQTTAKRLQAANVTAGLS